jgi:Flp pilus assembly pilin Flp
MAAVIIQMITEGRAAKAARLFARDCAGATAIEYGLLSALMGIALITTIGAVGFEVNRLFEVVLSLFP